MADEIKDYEEHVEDDVNIVGIHKSKKLFVVAVVCVVTGLVYYTFFRGDKAPEQFEEPGKVIEQNHVEKLLKEAESPAQETAPRILTTPPRLPELPPLVMPSVPDIPVVTKQVRTPVATQEETVKEIPAPYEAPKPQQPAEQELPIPAPYGVMSPERIPSFLGYDKERRGTPMLALGGGGGSEGASEEPGHTTKDFSSGRLEPTPSPNVKATRVGDPRHMVMQGHVIDAVLETAINSDIPGVLRAIVSRDVYASAGHKVMIPKGSRLIGSYFFDSGSGGFRVNVNWFRVILPNGVDVQLNSGGTDELGRNGVTGVVDTKVGATLTSTVLLAGVSLGTAFAASKIPSLKSDIVSTESTGVKKAVEALTESTEKKTSTNLPTQIVSDAIKDFSNSVKNIIKKFSDTQPTVYVDQGTIMKVFVNQDLVFPREAILQ